MLIPVSKSTAYMKNQESILKLNLGHYSNYLKGSDTESTMSEKTPCYQLGPNLESRSSDIQQKCQFRIETSSKLKNHKKLIQFSPPARIPAVYEVPSASPIENSQLRETNSLQSHCPKPSDCLNNGHEENFSLSDTSSLRAPMLRLAEKRSFLKNSLLLPKIQSSHDESGSVESSFRLSPTSGESFVNYFVTPKQSIVLKYDQASCENVQDSGSKSRFFMQKSVQEKNSYATQTNSQELCSAEKYKLHVQSHSISPFSTTCNSMYSSTGQKIFSDSSSDSSRDRVSQIQQAFASNSFSSSLQTPSKATGLGGSNLQLFLNARASDQESNSHREQLQSIRKRLESLNSQSSTVNQERPVWNRQSGTLSRLDCSTDSFSTIATPIEENEMHVGRSSAFDVQKSYYSKANSRNVAHLNYKNRPLSPNKTKYYPAARTKSYSNSYDSADLTDMNEFSESGQSSWNYRYQKDNTKTNIPGFSAVAHLNFLGGEKNDDTSNHFKNVSKEQIANSMYFPKNDSNSYSYESQACFQPKHIIDQNAKIYPNAKNNQKMINTWHGQDSSIEPVAKRNGPRLFKTSTTNSFYRPPFHFNENKFSKNKNFLDSHGMTKTEDCVNNQHLHLEKMQQYGDYEQRSAEHQHDAMYSISNSNNNALELHQKRLQNPNMLEAQRRNLYARNSDEINCNNTCTFMPEKNVKTRLRFSDIYHENKTNDFDFDQNLYDRKDYQNVCQKRSIHPQYQERYAYHDYGFRSAESSPKVNEQSLMKRRRSTNCCIANEIDSSSDDDGDENNTKKYMHHHNKYCGPKDKGLIHQCDLNNSAEHFLYSQNHNFLEKRESNGEAVLDTTSVHRSDHPMLDRSKSNYDRNMLSLNILESQSSCEEETCCFDDKDTRWARVSLWTIIAILLVGSVIGIIVIVIRYLLHSSDAVSSPLSAPSSDIYYELLKNQNDFLFQYDF